MYSADNQTYIRDIPEEYEISFAPFIGPNFSFMQNDPLPCIANVVQILEADPKKITNPRYFR